MRILAVEPILVEVPFVAPVRGVHGTTSVQRSVLVQVTTDGGVEGWGNVDPTPGYSLVSAADIHDVVARLAPALVGEDPFNLQRALAAMDRVDGGGLRGEGRHRDGAARHQGARARRARSLAPRRRPDATR